MGGVWRRPPTKFECYLCGHQSTRALVVAVGDRWRCKSGDACQRRVRRRLFEVSEARREL